MDIRNDTHKIKVYLWENKIKPFLIENNGCLEWPKSADNEGYGKIKGVGLTYKTHRVALEVATGIDLPKIIGTDFKNRLQALHKCDNPKCCNPEHLFKGTQKVNMIDKIKKGRGRKKKENI